MANVKRKPIKKTLYARGTSENTCNFFSGEAERLGYSSLGEYFNELAKELRGADAGRDKVRGKGRSAS